MSENFENPFLVALQRLEKGYELFDASESGRASSPTASGGRSSTPPPRTSSEALPDTPSRTPETPPDLSDAYETEELKLLAIQNGLIGNFDDEGMYQIPQLHRHELINMEKLITEKTRDYYTANSQISGKTLNFIVDIKGDETSLTASLKLVEQVKIQDTTLFTLTTELAKYSDINSPDFLFKLRKNFHLRNKDENVGVTSWKDYTAPASNVVGELVFKASELEIMSKGRDSIDSVYITALILALKSTKNGKVVIRQFLKEVRSKKYNALETSKFMTYRQIMDALVSEALVKRLIDASQLAKINQAKTAYAQSLKPIITANKDEAREKAEMALAVPSKSAGGKAKSGGGKKKSKGGGGKSGGGKSGGGGGGKSGGGKKKGGDKKGGKKEEKKPRFNTPLPSVVATAPEQKSGSILGTVVKAGAVNKVLANERIRKEIDPRSLKNNVHSILGETRVHESVKGAVSETNEPPKFEVKKSFKGFHAEIHL